MPQAPTGSEKRYREFEAIAQATCQLYKISFCLVHYNKSSDNYPCNDNVYLGEYHAVEDGRFTVKDNVTGHFYPSIHRWCVSVDKKTKIPDSGDLKDRVVIFCKSIRDHTEELSKGQLEVLS
jgi:hypothetical protein